MAQPGPRAHEEPRCEPLQLERGSAELLFWSITPKQQLGSEGRFARFRAAMIDPRQIDFIESMNPPQLNPPTQLNPSKRERWVALTISLGILAVGAIVIGLQDQPAATIEPAGQQHTSRGPSPESGLNSAPVRLQPLQLRSGAGLPSEPAEDVLQLPKAVGPTGHPSLAFGDSAHDVSVLVIADEFRTRLPTSREPRGQVQRDGDSAPLESNGQDGASSKLNDVETGNSETEVVPLEIQGILDLGPLVRIATLRHKENIAAVLSAFDRSLSNGLRFYTSKVEIASEIFHTVYVGPFESEHAAALMCQEMRRRGDDCSLAAR
jgi:hypothetical protein